MAPIGIPSIARTRRNHALEHATVHLLNQRYPSQRLIGLSTPSCFFVYGNVPTSAVRSAVSEALTRLARGEKQLAIHPHCGTNLVTAGMLVGLTAFLTMLPGDSRSRRARLPLVVLLSVVALKLAEPLGQVVQERITTDPTDMDGLSVHVVSGSSGGTPVHKVSVRHGA